MRSAFDKRWLLVFVIMITDERRPEDKMCLTRQGACGRSGARRSRPWAGDLHKQGPEQGRVGEPQAEGGGAVCGTEGHRVQRSQTRRLSSGSREQGGRQAEDSPGRLEGRVWAAARKPGHGPASNLRSPEGQERAAGRAWSREYVPTSRRPSAMCWTSRLLPGVCSWTTLVCKERPWPSVCLSS